MIKQTKLDRVVQSFSEDEWRELYLAHARGERTDLIPFPDDSVQIVTNSQKGEGTAHGALSILDCVLSCIREARPDDMTRSLSVLDYGCGWGRMTRLLPYYFDSSRIVGVDVDGDLVESANTLLPGIRHQQITSMQTLPFEDGAFDVVFANSVFSHLSEKSARFTLRELARVLGPRGVLVISTLERSNMDQFYASDRKGKWIEGVLGPHDEAASQLDEAGFIWGDTGRWHEYGIAITTDAWITTRFQELDLDLLGTKYGQHQESHNYKFGVKRS